MEIPFRSVQAYPERKDASGIVLRLIDAVGFRFYWATQDLAENDYAFSPGQGCFTIGHLIAHIWDLVAYVRLSLSEDAPAGDKPVEPDKLRAEILETLLEIRTQVENMPQEDLFALTIRDLPFWHFVNGPLADALTHIGQITSFRRLNGNAVPRHSVFLCREESK